MQDYQHQIQHTLRNGTNIFLRTILAEDKSKIREGFKLLSPESRYTRFFHYLNGLSEAQLEYLANVDQLNHVAWGVADPSADPELGIAVGRFIRVETCPNCAELALTVIDDYQGQGIGTVLLALLYLLAQNHEIDFFVGTMLSQNHRFLLRLQRLGANVTAIGDGVSEFRLPIYQDSSSLPENQFTPRWKELLSTLSANLFKK